MQAIEEVSLTILMRQRRRLVALSLRCVGGGLCPLSFNQMARSIQKNARNGYVVAIGGLRVSAGDLESGEKTGGLGREPLDADLLLQH